MRRLRRFLSASAFAIGCSAMCMGEDVLAGGAIASMSLLLWPWGVAQDHQTGNTQNLGNEEDLEALDKARADYAMIQGSIGMLRDKAMAAQVKQLQATAGRMLSYLDSHPQRIPSAMRFIDYYQDRTATLMQQYVSLRETGLETQAMDNLQRDMRTTFQGFAVAYEKQFAKVIDNEILAMDAKLKVARQLMQDDGINYDALEPSDTFLSDDETSKEKAKGSGWNLRQAGIAIGAVAVGAFGLWKIFGEVKKE